MGCTSPCALLALRFSETEAPRDTYPETPARAWGSAFRRGVAALSAGLAAQIRREVSGEVWRSNRCTGWCTRASALLLGLHPLYNYPANSGKTRGPPSGLEPLTPAPATSWLVTIPGRTTPYRYGAYRSRTLSRGGVAPPTVYRRVPARLQYDCSKRARSCFTTDSGFPRVPSRRHHLRLPRPAERRAPLLARTGRRPLRKGHLLCRSSRIRL